MGNETGLYGLADAEFLPMKFVTFELNGERRVIWRHTGDVDDGWERINRVFLESRSREQAVKRAAEKHAADALRVLRSRHLFETADEFDEQKLVKDVCQVLDFALTADDAFLSASMFCRKMKVSGFDAMFFAFHDRWRPSIKIEVADRLASAREMERKFIEKFPSYEGEIDRIRIVPDPASITRGP